MPSDPRIETERHDRTHRQPAVKLIDDQLDIAAGMEHITRQDPDMAAAFDRVGAPEPRHRPPGFPALLNIIVSQQVSVSAAAAIWRRLEERGMVTPERVLLLGFDGLRAIGFSRPKIRYALALAEQVAGGSLRPHDIVALDEAAATARLTSLAGFGRWSAEIYLMFCLGRPDIWPAGDVALQEATRAVKGLDARPDVDRMDRLSQPWRPWRSVAALLLWRYYRLVVRGGRNTDMPGFQ